MPIEKHELEQARLHFHSTVVKVPLDKGGFAQLGELREYQTDCAKTAYWEVYYPRADFIGWRPSASPSYENFEFEPYYPDAGYYNMPQGAVYYTRSGKKQWQQSYSLSANHSIIKPLRTPLSVKSWDKINVQEASTIRPLFYPTWTTIDEAMESLSEPATYRRRKPYSYAINKKLALVNMFPNKPPVLMYQQIPVGYMDGRVGVLAPTLKEFVQDISNYMEVRVA